MKTGKDSAFFKKYGELFSIVKEGLMVESKTLDEDSFWEDQMQRCRALCPNNDTAENSLITSLCLAYLDGVLNQEHVEKTHQPYEENVLKLEMNRFYFLIKDTLNEEADRKASDSKIRSFLTVHNDRLMKEWIKVLAAALYDMYGRLDRKSNLEKIYKGYGL